MEDNTDFNNELEDGIPAYYLRRRKTLSTVLLIVILALTAVIIYFSLRVLGFIN